MIENTKTILTPARRILSISGGMASAEGLFRTIERYGHDGTLAVFADTNWEHPDTYRFLDDVERVSGLHIHRLNDGRNIWDVFFQSHFFSLLNGGCKASWELKKEPLQKFHNQHGNPQETTVLIGFTADETDRQSRLVEAMQPWKVDFPLCWGGYSTRCDLHEQLRARGVEPPVIYGKGYPHNNCRGGCILAGIGQWCGVLKDDREFYLLNEEKEQSLLAELRRQGRTEITILKDRRGGRVNNLSLRQLREEVESGERKPRETWRISTCSCMGRLFAD